MNIIFTLTTIVTVNSIETEVLEPSAFPQVPNSVECKYFEDFEVLKIILYRKSDAQF